MVDVGLEPFFRNVQVRNIAKVRRLRIYIRHLVVRAQLERMDAADSLPDGPRTLWSGNISAVNRRSSRNKQYVPRGKQPLDPIKATLCSITLVLSLIALNHLAVTRQHRQLIRLSAGSRTGVECIEQCLETPLRFR